MPKDQMKERHLWLYAHPKLHRITQQLINNWPSKETRKNIYATIARNLNIGHETIRRKNYTYD